MLYALLASLIVWSTEQAPTDVAAKTPSICSEEMKLVYTASVSGETLRVCSFTDPLKFDKNQVLVEGFELNHEESSGLTALLKGSEQKRYRLSFAKSEVLVTEFFTLNKDTPAFETKVSCSKGKCNSVSEKCIFKGYSRPSQKLTVKHMLSRESKPSEIQLLAGWALSGDVKAQTAFFQLPATVQMSEESEEEFTSWKEFLLRLQKSKCLPRK